MKSGPVLTNPQPPTNHVTGETNAGTSYLWENNVHLDRKDRLCLVCSSAQDVEDEHHFLFECPAYSSIRASHANLYQCACSVSGFFDNCEANACGGFIRDCFSLKEQYFDSESIACKATNGMSAAEQSYGRLSWTWARRPITLLDLLSMAQGSTTTRSLKHASISRWRHRASPGNRSGLSKPVTAARHCPVTTSQPVRNVC